jgi:hypothetical protein
VDLAHPAQAVLLAGLRGEIGLWRVVGFDLEPDRADAFAQVCHVDRPFDRGRPSGDLLDMTHSVGAAMQGRT